MNANPTINELREFYGSIGRRVRVITGKSYFRQGMDGEYTITGYSVEKLDDGRVIYQYKISSDEEYHCGYIIRADAVEFVDTRE